MIVRIAFLFALLLPLAAVARPAWISGTFIYADLCASRDGKGFEGHRVILRRFPTGDGGTYEAASGLPAAPMPVGALSIDDGSRQIAFTVEGRNGPIRFEGTAAADALAGTIRDAEGEHPLRLPRVLRLQPRETCAARSEPSAASLN